MKKAKIIGLLVACGGVVASFAAASALYKKGASDVNFGIGAHYEGETGDITYKISNKTSGSVTASYLKDNGTNGGTGLGGEYTQAEFVFPLSAVYDVNPQPYVVGSFKVELKNIAAELQGHSKIWIEVKGWTGEYEGKWGASDVNAKPFNYHEATIDDNHYYDYDITGSSYSVEKDITVSSSGEQSVHVYVKLDSSVASELPLALAETTPFTINVTWGAPSEGYEFAYVVGDKNQWTEDLAYAMTPNIKDSSFSWWFSGLTGFNSGKVKKGSSWSDDPDATLDPTKSYNVYWAESGTASFSLAS